MPIDLPFQLPGDILGDTPRTLLAALLLGGPTIAWITYRAWIGPRLRRQDQELAAEAYWTCGSCASANLVGSAACYRCHQSRDTGSAADRAVGEPVGRPDDGVGVAVMAAEPDQLAPVGDRVDRGTFGEPDSLAELAIPIVPAAPIGVARAGTATERPAGESPGEAPPRT